MINCPHMMLIDPNHLWAKDLGITITKAYKIRLTCPICDHYLDVSESEYRKHIKNMGFCFPVKSHTDYLIREKGE